MHSWSALVPTKGMFCKWIYVFFYRPLRQINAHWPHLSADIFADDARNHIMFWHDFRQDGGAPWSQCFLLQTVSEHASSKYLDWNILKNTRAKTLKFVSDVAGGDIDCSCVFLTISEKHYKGWYLLRQRSIFEKKQGSRNDRWFVSNHNYLLIVEITVYITNKCLDSFVNKSHVTSNDKTLFAQEPVLLVTC